MTSTILVSYTDRLSYAPGQRLKLFVSSPVRASARISMVKLNRALESEKDVGSNPVVDWGPKNVEVSPQQSAVGSFLKAALDTNRWTGDGLTLGVVMKVTASHIPHPQTLVWVGASGSHVRLILIDKTASLEGKVGGNSWSVSAERKIYPDAWYLIAASIDRNGNAAVRCIPLDPLYGERLEAHRNIGAQQIPQFNLASVAASNPRDVAASDGVIRGRADDFFNGKLESPFVASIPFNQIDSDALIKRMKIQEAFGEALVETWDLSLGEGDNLATVRSAIAGSDDGLLVNGPARGATGSRWTGECLSFVQAPNEYAAIHFHETDLVDAGWEETLSTEIPSDLPSGVYGLKVRAGESVDVVPFVVTPGRGAARKAITVLLPTFSYLAYANEMMFDGFDASKMTDKLFTVAPNDLARIGSNMFGLSLYDHHPDGSGVMYSSASRPIANMRPEYRMWLSGGARGFSAEMYLFEWLDRKGFEFDVVTDLELHQRGEAALDGAKAVITGSHPEYYSGRMLTAVQNYRDAGGGLLYLGGNGFYWVTEVFSESPLVIEVRRGLAGIRAWESYPGETTLVSTRTPGGLWRHRGRAPQTVAGVGFCAQGWGRSEPYKRTEAGHAKEHAWIFEGVTEDPIGAYGRVMGGASGDEIDRADFSLGTPPGAVVLASSGPHTNYYQRVIEEVHLILDSAHGGETDPDVRADMVYFKTPAGGQVFSVGSIAWSGALLHNKTDNAVSRITENVIRRFVG